jgi:cytochrome c553
LKGNPVSSPLGGSFFLKLEEIHAMKKILATLMLMGVAAFALMMVNIGKGNARGDDDFESRAQIGLRIAPLPLNLEGRNAELVGYGSYLVNAAAICNDCHSIQRYATGGDPFLGQPKQIDATSYLRGGLELPGDNGQLVISRNIRPELPSGLPASKTFAQFSAVFRHGTDFDNPGQILQVMPWPAFQSLTNDDIRAIYEYLSALPPATALGGG